MIYLSNKQSTLSSLRNRPNSRSNKWLEETPRFMRYRRPDLQENLKKNDNSSHKHLKDRLENVEIAEWCTDVIVPRMEEHVSCGGMNHFAHKCRANPRGLKSRVSAVHEAVDTEDDPYYIGAITRKNQGQEQLAVVKLHIYRPRQKSSFKKIPGRSATFSPPKYTSKSLGTHSFIASNHAERK